MDNRLYLRHLYHKLIITNVPTPQYRYEWSTVIQQCGRVALLSARYVQGTARFRLVEKHYQYKLVLKCLIWVGWCSGFPTMFAEIILKGHMSHDLGILWFVCACLWMKGSTCILAISFGDCVTAWCGLSRPWSFCVWPILMKNKHVDSTYIEKILYYITKVTL